MQVVPPSDPTSFWTLFRAWWREYTQHYGRAATTALLIRNLWEFALESTPAHRRQRYGDMEYDWDYRVNTSGATVHWKTRLLGFFHSAYQPTELAAFQEMMASLPIDFRQFTFLDLGSGKGRTLLMASDYSFKRIIGVELFEELHNAALQNIREHRIAAQRCSTIESIHADARNYRFPDEPLVVYLFNPLPELALSSVVQNLRHSLEEHPRPVWVLYHNALLERVLQDSGYLERVGGASQFSLYKSTYKSMSVDGIPQLGNLSG